MSGPETESWLRCWRDKRGIRGKAGVLYAPLPDEETEAQRVSLTPQDCTGNQRWFSNSKSHQKQQETDGTLFKEVIHGSINEGTVYKGVHSIKGNRNGIMKHPGASKSRKGPATHRPGGAEGALTGIPVRAASAEEGHRAGASGQTQGMNTLSSFLSPPPVSCRCLPLAKPSWKPEGHYTQCMQW